MKYLHTMVRVTDVEASLDFYVNKMGMVQTKRNDYESGRFSLIFLTADEDAAQVASERAPELELTYNWDGDEEYTGGRNFGHLCYSVKNIYEYCQRMQDAGVTINRPPRDGRMAFFKSPDGISFEILQQGEPLPAAEPWASMENTGSW
ncbi:Glyoxalase/Bleomycin resistance protein/dioxygenase domain:Glyoxalase I [Rhodobacterales bacterium HTCC2150]|nr:Glyoxalase/Bleomycin resistance protein/dioxygenase domain:Glyoxalase I [Rhodobacterales bacterium HTCC2150] [Rhodobacteraceae bacterium HTCC2150]